MFREKIKNFHFVGIGGIGMSGIAQVLLQMGYRVSGSDLRENKNTELLRSMGAKVFIGHREENLGDAQVVEGKETVKAVKELSEKLNIYAPISWAVYRVVVEGEEPLKVARELLLRPPQNDFEGL